MTKAEVLKWMLFVGNEPIEWNELLKRHPDADKDGTQKRYRFELKFGGWQINNFVGYSKQDVKVDEGISYILKFHLTDKARDRLNGKRIKKTGWEGAIAKYRRRKA